MRSVRTRQFSYIRYYAPGRYDCTDGGPTIDFIRAHLDDPAYAREVSLCITEHPAEELYDLRKDPDELKNVAADPAYAAAKAEMAARLDGYLRQTKDPRITGEGIEKMENAPRLKR